MVEEGEWFSALYAHLASAGRSVRSVSRWTVGWRVDRWAEGRWMKGRRGSDGALGRGEDHGGAWVLYYEVKRVSDGDHTKVVWDTGARCPRCQRPDLVVGENVAILGW